MVNEDHPQIDNTAFKQIDRAKILSPTYLSLLDVNDNDKQLALLERKIALAIEDFTTHKLCELILKDRDRMSEG